ncbi:MAG: hypothetical protein JSR71_09635 [Proteobacteria bacterium]|nr:hypothetical protein [Pseudomonadota bacterium]
MIKIITLMVEFKASSSFNKALAASSEVLKRSSGCWFSTSLRLKERGIKPESDLKHQNAERVTRILCYS